MIILVMKYNLFPDSNFLNSRQQDYLIDNIDPNHLPMFVDIIREGMSLKQICKKYNFTRQHITTNIFKSYANSPIGNKVNVAVFKNTYINDSFAKLPDNRFKELLYPILKRRTDRVPINVRKALLENGSCSDCGSTEDLTIDHLRPITKGGMSDKDNLDVKCMKCNIKKSNK